jgi:hypothetical protein
MSSLTAAGTRKNRFPATTSQLESSGRKEEDYSEGQRPNGSYSTHRCKTVPVSTAVVSILGLLPSNP